MAYQEGRKFERKHGELVAAQDEYIDLLGKSEASLIGLAYVHGGGVAPELVEKGKQLREKIANLKLVL